MKRLKIGIKKYTGDIDIKSAFFNLVYASVFLALYIYFEFF